MRKKIIAVLATIAFLAVVYAQPVVAQAETVEVYAWTDKSQYMPGDTGTLHITIRNGLESAITIDTVKIWYPWYAYLNGDWIGNETIDITPPALSGGEAREKEIEFKIPSDGRLHWDGFIKMEVWIVESTDPFEPEIGRSPYVYVTSTPVLMIISDMDRWMTVLTTAIVICTIILAAVVFLSTRRPTIAAVAPRAKA